MQIVGLGLFDDRFLLGYTDMTVEIGVLPKFPMRTTGVVRSGWTQAAFSVRSDSAESTFLIAALKSSRPRASQKGIGLEIANRGRWARVEIRLGHGEIRHGDRFELKLSCRARTLIPVQAVFLICRGRGVETSVNFGTNCLAPASCVDVHLLLDWTEPTIEGDYFLAIQTNANLCLDLEDVTLHRCEDGDFFARERKGDEFTIGEREERADVVICVHNARDVAEPCVESVLANIESSNDRIVLVDDGSGALTRNAMLQLFYAHRDKISLIRDRAGSGYTKAVNRGIAASSGEICVLLNSDTLAPSGGVSTLIKPILENQADMAGPLSNRATIQSVPEIVENGSWAQNNQVDEVNFHRLAEVCGQSEEPGYLEVSLLNGFCLAVRAETLRSVGAFDERLFPTGYGEETDFEIRAQKLGFRSLVTQQTLFYHSGSQSFAAFHRDAYSDRAYSTVCAKHGRQSVVTAYENSRGILENAPIRAAIRYALSERRAEVA